MKPWACMLSEPECVLVVAPKKGIRRVSTTRFTQEIGRERLDRFRAEDLFICAHHVQFDPSVRSAIRRTDVIGREYIAVNAHIVAILAATEQLDLWSLVSRLFIYRPDAAAALAHTIALIDRTPGLRLEAA